MIYLEHKLLAEDWLDVHGDGRTRNRAFDVPAQGANGPVPKDGNPCPSARRSCGEKATT